MNEPRQLVRQFIWQHRLDYTVSTVAIILAEIIMVQFPHVLGLFTDALQRGQVTPGRLTRDALLLLVIGVSYVVFYGIGQYRNGHQGRAFEYELRRRLFLHWETLSTAYFRNRSIGDLLNHAMNDVRAVREALAGGVNILTNSIFLLISTLFMTFRTVSVELTLVSMIPMVFIPLFVIWWGPRIRTASKEVQEALSDMADLTEESLAAIRLIKATANEPVEVGRFANRVEAIVRRQMTMFRQSALFQSMIPLMGSISFVITLLYGGRLVLNGTIPLGAFVAFTLYLAMILTPLQQIGFVINNFQRASASLTRLAVLVDEQPDIREAPHPVQVGSIRGDVQLHISSFQYRDADYAVLKDIHCEVKCGDTLGIVGRTGSGKTTLVNLLPRIFDPPERAVFVDGYDVRDLPLSVLREAIAYVPQDGFLFSTTVGENIGFSKRSPSQAEIERAARLACIFDDIERFRDGFDTQIGERGVTLSGGQKQRTAIARALLKDAPILILDDSLSAVDMKTEKKLIEMLKKERIGKTTIIVSHRLSAVQHADQIVVLEDGTVVEQGTHAELVTLGGIYAQMYQIQQEGEGTSA